MTGIADAPLARIRAYAASLHGEMQGRSTTARLCVTEVEPAERDIIQPMKAWVEAIWDRMIEKEEAMDAWIHAMR